jgi:hypothetical protein
MDGALVFTSQKREQIRGELVAAAKADPRIGGAAHLGSAALGQLDRWSDIDLALCLAPDADLNQVLIDWTARLYRDHAVVANYDVKRGDILYRVFLLDSTLQVDLSFWPTNEFRAVGQKFRLIFGCCWRADFSAGSRFKGPDWNGLAVCAARAVEYRTLSTVAGRIYVERNAR